MSELARTQLRLSLGLLAGLCLTCLGVGLLAHFSPVMSNYVSWQLRQHREINGEYEFDGGYADTGDYVLIGQLPTDDFSRGGVYFIGASNTMMSIMPWELPPAERAMIHNYAMGDLNHREIRHLFQSLIEEQNFLQAGGEKTTVVLGLFYSMSREKHGRVIADDAVPLLFRRHGFYTYDPREGIHLVPMSSAVRFLRRERAYANRFLRIVTTWPNRVVPAEKHDVARYKEMWTNVMGPDWREDMEDQVGHLAALLDYLQKREVRVQVVFPPHPSWHDELPFSAAYREKVIPLLEARRIPIADMTHFLPDEEFADSTHCRYSGQWKVHRAYRELALRALQDMGTQLKP